MLSCAGPRAVGPSGRDPDSGCDHIIAGCLLCLCMGWLAGGWRAGGGWRLAGMSIVPNGILLLVDAMGRTTGDAYVQLSLPADATRAREKHLEHIGHRCRVLFPLQFPFPFPVPPSLSSPSPLLSPSSPLSLISRLSSFTSLVQRPFRIRSNDCCFVR